MARSTRPYHHGDLKRAVVEEAARLIESKGVSSLTLREVARRLGVSHAAPAHHFADKGALLSELGAEGFEQLADALTDISDLTPEARLSAQGKAYVEFALRAPGHFRVMFGGGLREAGASPRLEAAASRAYAALQQSVAAVLGPIRSRSPERLSAAVFLAWANVHGTAMLLLDGPLPGPPLNRAAKLALLEATVTSTVKMVANGL